MRLLHMFVAPSCPILRAEALRLVPIPPALVQIFWQLKLGTIYPLDMPYLGEGRRPRF